MSVRRLFTNISEPISDAAMNPNPFFSEVTLLDGAGSSCVLTTAPGNDLLVNGTPIGGLPGLDLNGTLNKLGVFPVKPFTSSTTATVAANQTNTAITPSPSPEPGSAQTFPTASTDGHWRFQKAIGSPSQFFWFMYNPRFGNPAAPLPYPKSKIQTCWALIRPTVNLYLQGYLSFNIYTYDAANPPTSGFYNTRWAYTNSSGIAGGATGVNLFAGYTYLIYANDAPRTTNTTANGVPDSQVSGFRDPYDIYTDVNHIPLSLCISVTFNPTATTNYITWTSTRPFIAGETCIYGGPTGNYNGIFYTCITGNTNVPPVNTSGVLAAQWAITSPQPSSYANAPVLGMCLTQASASSQAVGYVVLDMGFSYGDTTTTTTVSQNSFLTV